MDTLAAGKWNACLDYIRQNLDEKDFRWFLPLKFVSLEDGRLTVSVPSKTVYEYIGQYHRPLVQEALVREFGSGVQLIWRNEEAVAALRAREHPVSADKKAERKAPPLDPQLNSCYTFENFIEGEANKLARAVALSIAERPGQQTFNPFFLYGPSGVGKTHLVNAIGMRIRELYPEKRVLLVSAHVFKMQYTDASLHNTPNDFMHFYQSIDVLIIDDIQEITTPKTQQAFFHIFNHLQQNRRQIVMTCDKSPVELDGFEERMPTRFKWGMTTGLERPDIALRRAILEAKIRRDGLKDFPGDAVSYIAQHVDSSVRELEGIVNSIMAYSIMDNCDIDVSLAEKCVTRVINLEKRELTQDDIVHYVCRRYGVKQKELVSKSRRQVLAQARQLAMYLCHKYTGMSYSQIGRSMGGRDHSTVLYSCNLVARRITVDKNFRREVEELEAAFKK